MPDVPLKWHLGIDVVSKKTNLPHGAVTDALNVDIDRNGTLSRRDGYSLVYATPGVHDLWTSYPRSQSFAVVDGALCRVTMPWSSTALQALAQDAPFSYTDIGDDVVCGSRHELLVVASDMSVRRLGLETPGAPRCVALTVGGLDAGTYGVAQAYLRGDEEGALSRITFVTVAAGGGIGVTTPTPAESLPTKMRLYRTGPNGDELLHHADVGLTSNVGLGWVAKLGRKANTWALDRMIPGDFIRYWRGLLWVVRGRYAFHSEPMRYGVYSKRFNFVALHNVIRMFEPVEDGIYVGAKDGVHFISGKQPREFEARKLGGTAPIAGSAIRIPLALLGEDQDVRMLRQTGEYGVLWLAENGFVVGLSDGRIIEKQRVRITLSGNASTVLVHDRRVVAVVS